MSLNIVESIAKLHGILHLSKVDPNTQDFAEKDLTGEQLLVHATIPGVLAGFYQFTRSEQQAQEILSKVENTDWPNILFGSEKEILVRKISIYTAAPDDEVLRSMQQIGTETANFLREHADPKDGTGVKKLMTSQRADILQHLPGAIETGKALNDTSFDDQTNKMEGPVSSFTRFIESKFASSDTGEEKK